MHLIYPLSSSSYCFHGKHSSPRFSTGVSSRISGRGGMPCFRRVRAPPAIVVGGEERAPATLCVCVCRSTALRPESDPPWPKYHRSMVGEAPQNSAPASLSSASLISYSLLCCRPCPQAPSPPPSRGHTHTLRSPSLRRASSSPSSPGVLRGSALCSGKGCLIL